MPGGHSKHAAGELLPLAGLYLPTAQLLHELLEVLPVLVLYDPASQGAHNAWPGIEENDPAEHLTQSPLELLPVSAF